MTKYAATSMNLRWVFTIGCIATLSCCDPDYLGSHDVQQDRIFVVYQLLHTDFSGASIETSSMFRVDNVDGRSVELDHGSSVTFEEKDLASFYSDASQWQRTSLPTIRARYINNAFKVFETDLTLPMPIEVGHLPAVLERDSDFEVVWLGAPIGPSETVNCFVTTPLPNSWHVDVVQNVVGANSVTLKKDDLAAAPKGSLRLELQRSLIIPLSDAAPAGGLLRAYHGSKSVTVALAPPPQ